MLVSVMVSASSSGWQRLAKVGAVNESTLKVAGDPHVCATKSKRKRKSSPFASISSLLLSRSLSAVIKLVIRRQPEKFRLQKVEMTLIKMWQPRTKLKVARMVIRVSQKKQSSFL